jgi:hypothetical protein
LNSFRILGSVKYSRHVDSPPATKTQVQPISYPSKRFSRDHLSKQNRDSYVGIALGYGLDDRGSRVRFPAGAGFFSLHHRVQNGSGTHPASYPMGIMYSFPGGKAVEAWS